MAFQNKNLSVIAYANGFTLWHYSSASETLATITANGYFNNVKTLMNIGDIVIICGGVAIDTPCPRSLMRDNF